MPEETIFNDLMPGEQFVVHIHGHETPKVFTKMSFRTAISAWNGQTHEITLGPNTRKAPVKRVSYMQVQTEDKEVLTFGKKKRKSKVKT